MISRLNRCALIGLIGGASGCNLLTPLIFVGEQKKRVLPEFDKLPHRRVAVLVWTDPATLFDYPHARFELATYVADKLAYEMAQRGQGTEVVDPREVEDFLQRDVDAQFDPVKVGLHFRADYVIYLELLQFQIRDPDQPQFLRGTIQTSVAVFDTNADPDERSRFELAPVLCVYPERSPILISATNSPLVREATYRKFAELVARKFYEHTIDL